MIPVLRLNHAGLHVRDAALAAAWYRDVIRANALPDAAPR